MRRSALLPSVLSAALLVSALAVAQRKGLSTSEKRGWDLPTLQSALLDASNAARAEVGLGPLTADPGLARSAQAHAEENAERGVLDHGSPDPARDELRERIALAGVALASIGENLALSVEDGAAVIATDIVGRWLASPDHRANLLDPDFTHVGFGAAAGTGGTYVTQHFGVRMALRTNVTARPERRDTARWHLSVAAPVGTRAALFAGSRPVTAFVVDAPIVDTSVPAVDGVVDVTLGVASGEGRYTASDRVRLDPDGSWSTDEDGPFGVATIEAARLQRTEEDGVAVQIAYDDPDLPFVLLVAGEHRPEVRPEGGVLATWLPLSADDREIAVGVLRVDGSIAVLERFTLTGGDDADLVPGVPTVQGAAP